jgi:hypothetical protein
LDILTRGLIDINLTTGSDYVRLQTNGTFHPVNQNGLSVTFGSGAQNTSVNNGAQHGSSATPTSIAYYTGRFGPGRLNVVTFNSTVKAVGRGLLTFEVDGNTQLLDPGAASVAQRDRLTQWLERASFSYQANRDESLAFGVRRIIGYAPMLDDVPAYQSGWNVSAAYHRIFGGENELYAVYGDASQFATVHQFIVKWIHYFGAGKGT